MVVARLFCCVSVLDRFYHHYFFIPVRADCNLDIKILFCHVWVRINFHQHEHVHEHDPYLCMCMDTDIDLVMDMDMDADMDMDMAWTWTWTRTCTWTPTWTCLLWLFLLITRRTNVIIKCRYDCTMTPRTCCRPTQYNYAHRDSIAVHRSHLLREDEQVDQLYDSMYLLQAWQSHLSISLNFSTHKTSKLLSCCYHSRLIPVDKQYFEHRWVSLTQN
jgi:hypothetical protein